MTDAVQITGQDGDNFLLGTVDADIISGLAGNDTMLGLAGNDSLDGGDGTDLMLADSGEDTLSGGNDNDTMDGGSGNDTVIGNRGDDLMIGGLGDDALVWNNGDGSDAMRGGEGSDTTQVNFFTDLENNDLQNQDTGRIEAAANGVRFARTELNGQNINGLFALDIAEVEALEVNFGGGDDKAEIVGDVANEIEITLEGGDEVSADTLDLSELTAEAVVDLDIENAGGPGLSQNGTVETNGATIVANDFEDVIGTDFEDEIFGNAENNMLSGGLANDLLAGGNGSDTIVGNRGDDDMRGGAGTDRLVWNNGDGSDQMDGGAGNDTTEVNFFTDLVEFDLQNADTARLEDAPDGITFARVELNGQTVAGLFQLDITNTETIEVNFGGGNDTAELVGDILSSIAVRLEGGDDDADAGPAQLDTADTLDLSELGSGVLVDLDVNDLVALPGGAPGAAAGPSENGTVTDETGTFMAEANDFENVVGSLFDDVIVGNSQNNVLDGNDGDDRVIGNNADDILLGGAGEDSLFGFGGDDTIDGGADDDVIAGNRGTDDLTGGEGSDTFIFNDGDGANEISDFDALDDAEIVNLRGISEITDFADLAANHLAQDGDDTVIDDGAGTTITLTAVNVNDLDANDFLF